MNLKHRIIFNQLATLCMTLVLITNTSTSLLIGQGTQQPGISNLDPKVMSIQLKPLEDLEIPADGFLIKRKTSYLGRWITHSGWYPDRKLRLFKKDKSRWHGRIHERLELDGTTRHMDGDILHYTYRNITDHINRLNRYSQMQAKDIVDKKKKCFTCVSCLCHRLPLSAFISGNWES